MTREEAINKINWALDNNTIEDVQSAYDYIIALKMAIEALQTDQRWIPVSERLPEKQDCYLVTTKWKGWYSEDVYIETNMAVYREKPKEWDCANVIAWMPLPEPFKEESEG